MSRSDNIANLIVIGLGIFVVYHSFYSLKLGILVSPGAGFLPFLCGIAFIVLGLFWRLQTILFKSPKIENNGDGPGAVHEAQAPSAGSRIKLWLAFLATVVYAWLFERIGFFLATLLFMLVWQKVVERQSWLKAIIVTVLCAAAMYALFRLLLHVELPPNPLLS
jgi:hypothetical protein